MEINYGKFYTYGELEEILKNLAEAYPDYMRLSSLAVTEEGRNIYLAEITENVDSVGTENKPGYYIQSSLHASEPSGGTISLHFIEYLLNEKPDILKEVVFYIVPRVNPDGVEGTLVNNLPVRSKNVCDIKRKENIIHCKDMDGDDLVLQMRIKNPLGNYKEIAPGVMVSREPGEEEGEFYDVYVEGEVINNNGTALDYDHRCYDYNRSFPANWQPIFNSTEYPLRSIENRAIAEFLVTHPNIFAGIDYHNGSNGILRSPMCEDSEIDKQDLELILNIGNLASEITGFPLIQEYKYGKYPTVLHGNTNEFAYKVLGISHYVIELGNGINDIGYDTESILKSGNIDKVYKDIKEYSEKEGYDVFYEFKPYMHPQLGFVEIGGLRSGRGYYQNPKTLIDIAPKTTEFMLKHASFRPELKLDCCETVNLSSNIVRIRVQVKNLGFMGTKIMKGSESYQASYPVHVYLEHNENVEILSRPNVYELPCLNSMESSYMEWFVRKTGDSKITICAEHPKAITAKISVL